ncbi:MAG: hypothetical protein EPN73_02750 [Paraburkholderia sp.]|uniref:hypothetical protein n=1 Tax=Paraburkholderia sp. TaxID=1926495 RepID=UPI00122958C4|nr:hypothetical protein [Paraburkholderia sp.]TAL98516.1 MAG: hypothetical protein EPN73_02750 [Paraburkholderia sp.]
MASDYQVKVARDIAGYDDSGIPRVRRGPARVVVVAAQREMVFGDRDALERFVFACRQAGDEAFSSSFSSSISSQDAAHADAWCRFFERILKL